MDIANLRRSRSSYLLGPQALHCLAGKTVAVFGLGGVGSASAEALARSGVGTLRLIDGDCVDATNLNRQLVSTVSGVGHPKAEEMSRRIAQIAPDCHCEIHSVFYRPGDRHLLEGVDLAIDAIDSVKDKIDLIVSAGEMGIPILSAMGCGNKLDPTRFEIADLYDTSVCPLCRVMRRELKKRGVTQLPVVYSREEPQRPFAPEDAGATPGSVSWVPPVAGMILAGHAIQVLIQEV